MRIKKFLILAALIGQFSNIQLTAHEINFKDLTVKTVSIIDNEPNFAIDGAFHELEYGLLIKPIIKSEKSGAEHMMAPMRDLFEKLPGDYHYDAAAQEVTLGINNKTVKMKVGSTDAFVNGNLVKAPYAPELHHNPDDSYDSLYLPAKFIFENLDTNVKWEKNRNRFVATVILAPKEGVKHFPTGGKWTYKGLLNRDEDEFGTPTAIKIADHMLDYQNADGGWMKLPNDADMTTAVKGNTTVLSSTIDNDATFVQMRFLAKVYNHTKDKKYAESIVKGVQYLIDGQYPNGGWAQYFPNGVGYFKHITINDDAMVNVLETLQEVFESKGDFSFISQEYPETVAKAKASYDKGLQTLLDLQIDVNGQKTAWAAQYDRDTLQPVRGRAYELPSISGGESVKVLRFLMSLDSPSPEVITAVKSGVQWFEQVKIEGKKMVSIKDNTRELGMERFLVDDPQSTVWGRFYEIETLKPIFSSRDGIAKYDMSEISYERRNKYSWYTTSPAKLLSEDYPEWLKKIGKI